jgi:two-component system cell cycle sensor histidine kinase/response regulator CckA
MEMSVVYGIVTHHDGWIDVESTLSHTRITIYLPVSMAIVGGVDEEDNEIVDFKGDGQRLLLVEDEQAVRSIAEKMLTSNGYEVLSASDANEAFRIFAREKGEIDAVFADVIMPGQSGISLADQLAEHNKNMPIILTSGRETTVDEWRSIQDNGYYFIPKPYCLASLLREIGKAFNQN